MAPRVSLRTFEPRDAAAVHRWFNNFEAVRSLVEYRESFGEDDARRWVEAAGHEGPDRKWAVLVEGYEQPVGFTALYGVGRQTAPEIGVLLGEDSARGRGVGTLAQGLTVERGFEELGAHRITALIPATNARSRAAFERLGFVYEGLMRSQVRRGDEVVDVTVYGLLPEEWAGVEALG